MIEKGVAPDVITYNCLVQGLCNLSKWKDVENLFTEMKAYNIVPDVITFNILIDAPCKEGQLAVAEQVLTAMIQQNQNPTAVTDRCMPRSSRTSDLIFDPEVEKTARRTRKETRQFREEHSSATSQRPESGVEPTDSFGGTSSEEPYKHLQEFDVVCNSMKPPGITEEQIKMRAFPFSLKDSAKDWAASLRKEICGIKQRPGESLYEYWERFNFLLHKCPQHQISEQLLIQYFYEGLLFGDRSIIDAASGGALVNKTPQEARELIERMAENSQQFGTREDCPIRRVNEVETPSMQQQLAELTAKKLQNR
ncbi:pentatricopeptide repeat-containing protein At2g15630, mitochondrial-like [Coffea eugenioides]|uniref:pentatricopeptide repeat-containing protein At2g15630, mitochondrial-like n=1 Tax=Coffea eugenioides TaxID=49369 RepID=UPI000F605905|nr:pentatricopeptide repeat-containing protein At2g15630, mitochondrial-like [Coffea eugenioides]